MSGRLAWHEFRLQWLLIVLQIMKLQGRVASNSELETVHSSAHVATMKRKSAEDAPCVVADFEEPPDNTTYMAKSTFDDALQVCTLPPLWCHVCLTELGTMHHDLLRTNVHLPEMLVAVSGS